MTLSPLARILLAHGRTFGSFLWSLLRRKDPIVTELSDDDFSLAILVWTGLILFIAVSVVLITIIGVALLIT